MSIATSDMSAVNRIEQRKRTRWVAALGVLVVLVIVGVSFYLQLSRVNVPVTYANDEDHFKYGSIGSDVAGVPYWVFKVMPDICPTHLPGGFASLGVVQEPGHDTPIGFSMRRVGPVDIVGPNCALCHTGTVRTTADADPQVYITAPAHQLNLMNYFRFLFACGRDPAFTASNIMPAIAKYTDLSLADRLVFRFIVIPQLRTALQAQGQKFDSIVAGRPDWGPGRVDTFNPYKVLLFNMDMSRDRSIGTARFMSIWHQGPQEGIWHHWDGNNDSLDERNLSAAIGAGVQLTPKPTFDFAGLERVKNWLLPRLPPRYPYAIDLTLAGAGKPIYDRTCASCHDSSGEHFGTVTPLARIGTDPERSLAFDKPMADRMNSIGEGYPWRFHRFRSTNGYANHSLEGIWLRAPYLHNGSVPTLDDLLKPEAQRPKVFFVGNDVYDQQRIGFVYDADRAGDRSFVRFDTSDRGNGNQGHNYGNALSDQDRRALLEYLKTL